MAQGKRGQHKIVQGVHGAIYEREGTRPQTAVKPGPVEARRVLRVSSGRVGSCIADDVLVVLPLHGFDAQLRVVF
jgi:hypothetical protein